jgi:hypothetical protein
MAKIGPEHSLQVKINQTAREVIDCPHLFFSIDRTKRNAEFEHVRQKNRGMVAGTSDTVLLCLGLPGIVVELKAPGETPDDNQNRFGAHVQTAGHLWGWCDTVVGWCRLLIAFGVPLRRNWEIIAAGHDATIEGAAIKREEARTGVPSKKRTYRQPKVKPTAAQLRKVRALYAQGHRF